MYKERVAILSLVLLLDLGWSCPVYAAASCTFSLMEEWEARREIKGVIDTYRASSGYVRLEAPSEFCARGVRINDTDHVLFAPVKPYGKSIYAKPDDRFQGMEEARVFVNNGILVTTVDLRITKPTKELIRKGVYDG